MIYTKKANFPYPVLMNYTDDYQNAEFELDVNLRDNSDNYILDITWSVSSRFIQDLLKRGKAVLVLIIKSKDNQFFFLKYGKKLQQIISKNKLSLNTKTVIQLMIQTQERVSFCENPDLNPFYDDIKPDINIAPGNVLGFSNTVIFDGNQQKPFDLFEKMVDPNINSDIEIRLGNETIIIVYKNESLQFPDVQRSRQLNYPYLYMGLQKALTAFILHANPDNPDDGVIIEEMDLPQNSLDIKLYNLMKAKNIDEISFNTMDEAIYQMSDNMIAQYTDAVRGLQNDN